LRERRDGAVGAAEVGDDAPVEALAADARRTRRLDDTIVRRRAGPRNAIALAAARCARRADSGMTCASGCCQVV
jgi:hypothetical protein